MVEIKKILSCLFDTRSIRSLDSLQIEKKNKKWRVEAGGDEAPLDSATLSPDSAAMGT